MLCLLLHSDSIGDEFLCSSHGSLYFSKFIWPRIDPDRQKFEDDYLWFDCSSSTTIPTLFLILSSRQKYATSSRVCLLVILDLYRFDTMRNALLCVSSARFLLMLLLILISFSEYRFGHGVIIVICSFFGSIYILRMALFPSSNHPSPQEKAWQLFKVIDLRELIV